MTSHRARRRAGGRRQEKRLFAQTLLLRKSNRRPRPARGLPAACLRQRAARQTRPP